MRLEPAGPIILAFNDHKRTAIVTNGKEEKPRPGVWSAAASGPVAPLRLRSSPATFVARCCFGGLSAAVPGLLDAHVSAGGFIGVFDADWRMVFAGICSVAQQLADKGGQAPGLRFHYPWMLQVGCKLLVAYSKFYVTGF
eukprot:gene9878-11699_t